MIAAIASTSLCSAHAGTVHSRDVRRASQGRGDGRLGSPGAQDRLFFAIIRSLGEVPGLDPRSSGWI
jgi:hypothetical protein